MKDPQTTASPAPHHLPLQRVRCRKHLVAWLSCVSVRSPHSEHRIGYAAPSLIDNDGGTAGPAACRDDGRRDAGPLGDNVTPGGRRC
jgi:hypothetical protein